MSQAIRQVAQTHKNDADAEKTNTDALKIPGHLLKSLSKKKLTYSTAYV